LALEVGVGTLSLIKFQGRVEEGKFGPGEIRTWDSGRYERHKWEAGKIIFTLTGSRVKGTYALIIFPRGGENSWLLSQTKAGQGAKPFNPVRSKLKTGAISKPLSSKTGSVKNKRYYGAGYEGKAKRKISYHSMRRMSVFQWDKRDFRLLIWIALAVALGYGIVFLLKAVL